MTFMVSNGKIILKVSATFKIHKHSHKNTITLSLKRKLVSSPSKQGQTCFISFFQHESAYGIEKIRLKNSPEKAKSLKLSTLFRKGAVRPRQSNHLLRVSKAGTLETKAMLVDMEKHRHPHPLGNFGGGSAINKGVKRKGDSK